MNIKKDHKIKRCDMIRLDVEFPKVKLHPIDTLENEEFELEMTAEQWERCEMEAFAEIIERKLLDLGLTVDHRIVSDRCLINRFFEKAKPYLTVESEYETGDCYGTENGTVYKDTRNRSQWIRSTYIGYRFSPFCESALIYNNRFSTHS